MKIVSCLLKGHFVVDVITVAQFCMFIMQLG